MYRLGNMLARHIEVMQLLLVYCIVVQSCVLCDVDTTLTPTESSTESEISGATVGRANDDPRTTESSLFDTPMTLVKKKAILSAKEVISIPSLTRIMKGSELVKNGETEDTANEEYVDIIRDNELDWKGNDRVLSAIHKRDRSLEEGIGLKNFPAEVEDHYTLPKEGIDLKNFPAEVEDHYTLPKEGIGLKNFPAEVENHYTLPKVKKSFAFKDGESTIRNKRHMDYIYPVTANSRKNKRKSFKIRKNTLAPPKLT